MTIPAVLNNERTWHVETTDVLAGLRSMPDECVHQVLTSPPYWMIRDYGFDGQLGMEDTPDEYIANQVAVFSEVFRVLRRDGTLWLNIGDCYCNDAKGPRGTEKSGLTNRGEYQNQASPPRMQKKWRKAGKFKRKDLVGIPWMLAFALRDAGWYLRSDNIWNKPGIMPGSQKDRPTRSHEYLFMFSKRPRYFYDWLGSSEQSKTPLDRESKKRGEFNGKGSPTAGRDAFRSVSSTRVLRSVWTIATEPLKEKHFAAFPTKLVRPCLQAGCSEHGCCAECGAPWNRVVESERVPTRPGTASKLRRNGAAVDRQTGELIPCDDKPLASNGVETGNRDPQRHVTVHRTAGWEPTCKCDCPDRQPCIVLDPFNGAGTTGVVARRMQLRYVGLEGKPEYADMARRRIRDDAPLLNAS